MTSRPVVYDIGRRARPEGRPKFVPAAPSWIPRSQARFLESTSLIQRAWIPPDPPPTTAPRRVVPTAPSWIPRGAARWFETTSLAQFAWILPDPPPTVRPVRVIQSGAAPPAVNDPPGYLTDIDIFEFDKLRPPLRAPLQVFPFVAPTAFVPYTRNWLPSVLQAWQQPDPQRIQNTNTIPQAPGWQPIGVIEPIPQSLDAPYVFQVRYAPQGVSAQPATDLWLSSVIQSWQPADPPPTIPPRNVIPTAPGWQPIGVVEPIPPPPDVPYNFQLRFLPTSGPVAPPAQPYTNLWLSGVLASWQLPDPLPTLQRYVVPTAPGWQPKGVAQPYLPAWQPPDPLPTLIHYGIPPSQAVDNPPFVHPGRWKQTIAIRFAWQPPDPPPTIIWPDYSIPSTSVDNPPFGLLVTVVEPWIPDATYNFRPAKLPQPFVPGPSQPYKNAWYASVVASWQAPDPLPTVPPRRVIPSTQTDNPPFSHPGRSVQAYTIRYGWEPPDPLPTVVWPRLFIPFTQPDNPPFNHPGRRPQAVTVRSSWEPPDPLPTIQWPHVFIPFTQGDNPPFTNPGRLPWMVTARSAWEPPDPQPTINWPRFIIPFTPVDNPPFSHPGRWVQAVTARWAWEPPDPQPTINWPHYRIPFTQTDNPPFGSRTEMPNILNQWKSYTVIFAFGSSVIQTGAPPTPPIHAFEFEVSGPDVSDLFGPSGDVSWNWGGGVSKRTD